MSKILITGGAGFIGSHLTEKFAESNETEIIVLDNLSAGKHNVKLLKTLGVKLVIADITSNESLQSLPKKIDIIVHLAAMNRAPRSIKDPVMSNTVNIDGTVNILELARKIDCKFIFASSSSVFGHISLNPRPEFTHEFLPNHPYGLGKMASEHYCRLYNELYGLDTKIIRYFAVYGPRQSPKLTYSAVIPKFIKAVLQNQPIRIFGGDQTRNFTYVKDTIEATFLLATKQKTKNRVYQIGGPNEISINKLVDLLEEITGKTLEKKYLDYVKEDIIRSIPEMKNLKSDFGFSPKYSFQEGLKLTYNWFLSHPNFF